MEVREVISLNIASLTQNINKYLYLILGFTHPQETVDFIADLSLISFYTDNRFCSFRKLFLQCRYVRNNLNYNKTKLLIYTYLHFELCLFNQYNILA